MTASTLHTEVTIYVNPDGSVTFADMAGDMRPVAAALDPSGQETGFRGETPSKSHKEISDVAFHQD